MEFGMGNGSFDSLRSLRMTAKIGKACSSAVILSGGRSPESKDPFLTYSLFTIPYYLKTAVPKHRCLIYLWYSKTKS